MNRMLRAMVVGVSLAAVGMAVHTRAQSPPSAVRQVAYVKPSNPGTILVGSLDEDCLCTGIVQGRTDVGARLEAGGRDGAGAVYVFAFDTRGGTF